MPQITQLDNHPSPSNNDLLAIVDMAAGTTKNISREQFFTGAPLPANAVESILSRVYPVGSLYFNATNNTNPATLLGFGTWVAFGAGRVPVGFNSSESEFNAAEKTGGAKTHTLTEAQIPSHSHRITRWAPGTGDFNGGGKMAASNNNGGAVGTTGTSQTTGGGGAHNNLQPYITVYMWKRTA